MLISKELKIFWKKKIRYDYKKKNKMETAFKNKVAIITGGSSGRNLHWLSPKKEKLLLDWHESRKLCRVLQT
jgi:hypothetical protein